MIDQSILPEEYWDASHNLFVQQARADFHRVMHGCQEIRQGDMPRWWWERLCWRAGAGWGRPAAQRHMEYMEQVLLRQGPPTKPGDKLFQFWGTSLSVDPEGYEVLAVEPALDLPQIEFLACNVAKLLGLHWRVYHEDLSWCRPGFLPRLEFYLCISNPPCQGCLNQEQMRAVGKARQATVRRQRRRGQPGE